MVVEQVLLLNRVARIQVVLEADVHLLLHLKELFVLLVEVAVVMPDYVVLDLFVQPPTH